MIQVAWAAGILEGEGSFRTKTGCYSPVVQCQMTDLDVLEGLQELFGGTIIMPAKRREEWKQVWVWSAFGDSAASVMEQIRPFMRARRSEKIDRVLATWYNKKEDNEKKAALREQAAVAYLNNEGSLREVGRRFGVSYESVRRAVGKYN